MAKKIINAQALNIDGSLVENTMQVYMQDKSTENLKLFMQALLQAKCLVPAELPKNIRPEILEKIKKKEPIPKKDMPGMKPVLMKNQEGKKFLPVFTSKAYIPKDIKFQMVLPVDFSEVLRVAQAKDIDVKGILMNPSHTKLILNPPLIRMLDRVNRGEDIDEVIASSRKKTQKKEIKMTKDQFQVFVRRNLEVHEIPRRLFSERKAFLDALYEEGGELILEMFRKTYPEKAPFPYEAADFDVMVLDISDSMTVASIGLPSKNLVPGTCTSVYAVYNPQTDEARYYTIERTKEQDSNKLGQVSEEGAYTILGDAPAPGCEISGILEMLEQEKVEDNGIYS